MGYVYCVGCVGEVCEMDGWIFVCVGGYVFWVLLFLCFVGWLPRLPEVACVEEARLCRVGRLVADAGSGRAGAVRGCDDEGRSV